jgi:hypothetical protein
MKEKTAVELTDPPAYILTPADPTIMTSRVKHSRESKALFGYAVTITTALVVVLILGGIYYYRSLYDLKAIIKTYRYADIDIKIDSEKKTVVYRLSTEPDKIIVVDYPKSLTGIYDPVARQCYLIAGLRSDAMDSQALSDRLEKNMTQTLKVEKATYQIADSYPVSDKSILPSALKSPCAYLPVYWLEPDVTTQHEGTGIQKRGTWIIVIIIRR